MEVHAHTHTPRKKWTHYLWEFLMLFLAVFCGFLAENQREHIVEHKREKEYMKSMLEDLKHDTLEFQKSIRFLNEYHIPVLNKSALLLFSEDFSDSTIRAMYDIVPRATQFFSVIFQENTVTQLKNSGNLRLIRNKTLVDSLNQYWNACENFKDPFQTSFEKTRFSAKELLFSLFNYKNLTGLGTGSTIRKGVVLKLLSKDKEQFIKLGNYLSNLKDILSFTALSRLTNLDREATSLIIFIKKEYKLK